MVRSSEGRLPDGAGEALSPAILVQEGAWTEEEEDKLARSLDAEAKIDSVPDSAKLLGGAWGQSRVCGFGFRLWCLELVSCIPQQRPHA